MSISADYPDWLRVDQWIGAPLFDQTVANLVSGTVIGPFFVAPWEAVSYAFAVTGGGATALTLSINFYSDAALTRLVNQVAAIAPAGVPIVDIIPAQSLYMTVSVFLGATPRTVDVTIVPCRGFSPAKKLIANPVLWSGNAIVIGAGATQSNRLTPVTSGRYTWTVNTTAVAWSALLSLENSVGTILGIVGELGPALGAAGASIQVDLPPKPCSVFFTNLDGVNRQWGGAVVPLLAA